jgi:hypothetical protein
MQRTSFAKPDDVVLEAAYTDDGEARVQVKFDHLIFHHVESLSLPQAAALSAALREFVKR